MPESIAILVNYGPGMDRQIMYSVGNDKNGCRHDQIWDPFSRICRTIFCQSELDLVKFNFDCQEANWSDADDDVPTLLTRKIVSYL